MGRSARCYCGASTLSFNSEPLQVVYCHCDDCRRWTGAAAAALAAFDDEAVTGLGSFGPSKSFSPGVQRWNCPDCGSAMLARFEYVPGQSWVPLGVIADASDLAPQFHCFVDRKYAWLPQDELPGAEGTGRDTLNAVHPL